MTNHTFPYAAPSSKSGKSKQRPESGLTCCPIRPFASLPVCMKDLTADIFHALIAFKLLLKT
jgi:hypothetical protein